MDLICYLHPGWAPLIRSAPATRPWMDETTDSFAYRCLPLNIANAHGWEILSPCAFDAIWDGRIEPGAVTVRPSEGAKPEQVPVGLFGHGVLTFHIEGIFRTPPGWNLWVGGSPNRAKDGIAPLSGIIETDWSPFTFTMNWRFTRPGQWVHFDAMEVICFLFPVNRGAIEAVQPRFAPLESDLATMEGFKAWSEARDHFHRELADQPPVSSAGQWQKHYYRGRDASGKTWIEDHQIKLRLKPFDRRATPGLPEPPQDDRDAPAPQAATDEVAFLREVLAKREWLLETLEAQRDLAPALVGIERRAALDSEEFLELYYAANRPVILTGEMVDWSALTRWTPDYLKQKIGDHLIEYQGGRAGNPQFEMHKDVHRREAPFADFIDRIMQPGSGNDAYMTAYNSGRNAQAVAVLSEDLGRLDRFLDGKAPSSSGMMWIGPAGTVTSLHHDLTNNLIAQLVGRKRIKLIPPSEVGKLYNRRHVFSDIPDLEDPDVDLARYPRLRKVRMYDVTLHPGEILFMPLGWWHQVKALDFSVTVTYTNFLWPNDAYASYPPG